MAFREGHILYFSRRVAAGSVVQEETRIPATGTLTEMAVNFPSGGGLGVRLQLARPVRSVFPQKDAQYVDFRGVLNPFRLGVTAEKNQRLQAEWQNTLGTASYAPVLVHLEGNE